MTATADATRLTDAGQSDARSSSGWHQRTLGELAYAALVHAAKLKCEAMKARKLADRIFDRLVLQSAGSSVSSREAEARLHPSYVGVDDQALEAESAAIVAKAKADGVQIRFEEWRTTQATNRAEMTLR
jgi:hypothetical protein